MLNWLWRLGIATFIKYALWWFCQTYLYFFCSYGQFSQLLWTCHHHRHQLLLLLCKVFTIIYLKQTIFLGYMVLPLFCGYNIWYMKCYFLCLMFCISTLVCSEVCVHCPVWMFSVLPWFFAFLVCCFSIFWMILIWFLALLLMVSLLLLHPTCAVFWM